MTASFVDLLDLASGRLGGSVAARFGYISIVCTKAKTAGERLVETEQVTTT